MSAADTSFETGLRTGSVRHVEYIAGTTPEGALLQFTDPVAAYAVERPVYRRRDDAPPATAAPLAVALFPWGEAPETFAAWSVCVAGREDTPLFVKARGVELWWCAGQAVLQCDADEAEPLLAAVVEFTWYQQELRGLEVEIADGWSALEFDKLLAFNVTGRDLRGSDALGERMGAAFQRRIHFARLEPHLFAADTRLSATAQKLGNDLREKALFEDRAEAMDAHLEVFEHIYEMASQRMGEFRASHGSDRAEWIIIWLLVAEVTLSLLQVLFKR